MKPRLATPWAVLSGLILAALFYLPRLPQSADFILPRHAGFALFRAAIKAAQTPFGLSAASWRFGAFSLLPALGLALQILQWLMSGSPLKGLSSAERLRRLAVLATALSVQWGAAYFALGFVLDFIQNAWFSPESVNVLEPLVTWALFALVLALFLHSTQALLDWARARGLDQEARARRWSALAGGLLLLAFLLYGFGAWRYDLSRKGLAEAAGIKPHPLSSRTVFILAEKEGRPHYDAHAITLGVPGRTEYSPESLQAVERYLARSTLFTRSALRYLYAGYTLQMDAGRLRLALFDGHLQGDVLARVLLLDNLAVAPPGEGAASLLRSVADETAYRIGAKGAARIALACSHLGLKESAVYWRARASQGEGAIPAGLLPPAEEGGALKPGVIAGSVIGAKAVRVGLYARKDPLAPYGLGPAQFVQAVTADARGRFEFRGLAAGDYFLALAVDSEALPSRESATLRGHKGDIHLTAKRPSIELPPLRISL